MNRSKQFLFRFNGGEKEKKKSILTGIDAANVTFLSMDSLFNNIAVRMRQLFHTFFVIVVSDNTFLT